jgi:hypothetical protein|tara:strand:- start:560 stop:997 length:438 start_codon:yes stop_codon:yes gene_type:complete
MKNKEIMYLVGGVIATFLLMEKKATAVKKSSKGGGMGSGSTSGVGLLTPTAVESKTESNTINVEIKQPKEYGEVSMPIKGGASTSPVSSAEPIREVVATSPVSAVQPIREVVATSPVKGGSSKGFAGFNYAFGGTELEDSFEMDF